MIYALGVSCLVLVTESIKQVYIFSFLRQLQTWHCRHLRLRAVQQSTDISYPPGPQQQTRCCSGRMGQTDGRTDRLSLHRAFCAHSAWAVPVILGYYTGLEWLGSRVVSVLDSGAEGPGFKSQPRRCRVTVLGKLFTPIMPLFTKQRNW